MKNSSTQNILTKALAAFWLLDGLLQFQPKMFGPLFVSDVLMPTLQGQPGFVQVLIHFGIALWNTNTIWTNTAAALLQTAIGILLFFPFSSTTRKFGLYVSIVWGLIVWIFGEGFGMLLTGSASFYTGAPGGVLAYVILAALLLAADKIPDSLYARFAGWSLIILSLLQLQPTFWTSDGVSALVTGSSDMVGFISAFPTYLAAVIGMHFIISNILLILLPILLGVCLILRTNKVVGALALVFLFFVWWVGQDFGQLSTLIAGVSTDPNLAPLFALFILPLFLQPRRSATPAI